MLHINMLILTCRYHWALLVGPKSEYSEGVRGKRFHAKDRVTDGLQTVWEYSEQDIGMASTFFLLVRVQVAKVKSGYDLAAAFKSVPIKSDQPGWNCVDWVREALEAADKDKKTLGTSTLEWQTVRDTAMWYVEKKAASIDTMAKPILGNST